MKKFSEFETERLYLKLATTADAAFFLALMNTPKWLAHIGDRKVYDLAQATQYIIDRMLPQHERLGFGNYVVVRKDDGVAIGSCGLFDREGLEGLDIGFAFLPEYEGKGYAFEASKELLKQSFTAFKVSELQAITTAENTGSQRLLEKLGLKFVGWTRIPGDDEELMQYRIQKE